MTIVRNNNALGSELGFFRAAYDGKPIGKWEELYKYNKVDFAKVAESLGAVGFHVERPGDIRAALDKALASGKPAVVDVQVEESGPMGSWHNASAIPVSG